MGKNKGIKGKQGDKGGARGLRKRFRGPEKKKGDTKNVGEKETTKCEKRRKEQ